MPSPHDPDTLQLISDHSLITLYLEDIATSRIGVNFFIAKEMERRSLRNPSTADLTPAGKYIAEEVKSAL